MTFFGQIVIIYYFLCVYIYQPINISYGCKLIINVHFINAFSWEKIPHMKELTTSNGV